MHDKNLNLFEQRWLREPLQILKTGCSLNPAQGTQEGFEVEGVTGRSLAADVLKQLVLGLISMCLLFSCDGVDECKVVHFFFMPF